MTDSEHSGGKQLVKDGIWCVPADERPLGWETMAVQEMTFTESETTTTTTRTQSVSVKPQAAMICDAGANEQRKKPVRSFIPEKTIVHQKFARLMELIFESDGTIDGDDVLAIVYEQNFGAELADRIVLHNTAKARTDSILNAWIERNERHLRHIGLGSTAIRDLWWVVYGLQKEYIYSEQESAEELAKARSQSWRPPKCNRDFLDEPVKCSKCKLATQFTHEPNLNGQVYCFKCCPPCNPEKNGTVQ